RGRRRQGQSIPPGGDRCRHGLYGGAGSRALPGGCSSRRFVAQRLSGRAWKGPKGDVMDWDKLRIFHAVASAGSFTHAGQSLGLSQSAVSRQVSALEEEIATPLFQRHARGLTLTDEGELLYSAVSDVLARLGQAEAAVTNG